MHFVKQKYKLKYKGNGIENRESHTERQTRIARKKFAREKKEHFLYRLFRPSKIYLTFVFYLNV